MVAPGLVVRALIPRADPALLLLSVPFTVVLSVLAARVGAALWARRSASQDVVFADLMLWGWCRRVLAERRLAVARSIVGDDMPALDRDCRALVLERLSRTLDARDADTQGHSRRVARHAERLARAMHLPPAEVARVRTAATLHDIGKLRTPPALLNKRGRLSDEEFAVIRRHPVDGADMLAAIGDPEIVAMVRHHHERIDGTGYPDGLTGGAIPLGARIIAVADTFDAITSNRSYRRSASHQRALAVLSKEADQQLDGDVVSAFLAYYSSRRSVAVLSLLASAPGNGASWLQRVPDGLGGVGASLLKAALPALGAAALLAVPRLSDPVVHVPRVREVAQVGHAAYAHALLGTEPLRAAVAAPDRAGWRADSPSRPPARDPVGAPRPRGYRARSRPAHRPNGGRAPAGAPAVEGVDAATSERPAAPAPAAPVRQLPATGAARVPVLPRVEPVRVPSLPVVESLPVHTTPTMEPVRTRLDPVVEVPGTPSVPVPATPSVAPARAAQEIATAAGIDSEAVAGTVRGAATQERNP
jgi:putative nucleotidyltransferase with HDIG domain